VIATKTIRASLADLQPRKGIWFVCPGDQPHNRVFYQRVNGVAYAMWGPGTYSMWCSKGRVGIYRKAERAGGTATGC
jgi:hypothetical protein